MAYTDGHPGDRPPHGEGTGQQRVLNVAWPFTDPNGRRHAEGIPDQPNPVPVDVRLVLEHDGEVWLPGHAYRWTRTHVYVDGLYDDRVGGRAAVWVLAGDVRRR